MAMKKKPVSAAGKKSVAKKVATSTTKKGYAARGAMASRTEKNRTYRMYKSPALRQDEAMAKRKPTKKK